MAKNKEKKMSNRPECYLMKSEPNLENVRNTTIFIGVVEPIPFLETVEYQMNNTFFDKDILDSSILEENNDLDVRIELLNENMIEDLLVLFPEEETKIKVKKFDIDYYFNVFLKAYQGIEEIKKEEITCFYALDLVIIAKKEKILSFGNLGTIDFEKRVIEALKNSSLEYGVDYCYGEGNIKTIENELNVYLFAPVKKEGKILYESTNDYFNWNKILTLLPECSKINNDSFIRLILNKSDFDKYAMEKAFEKRAIEDWYFKEGRHVLFFNAP